LADCFSLFGQYAGNETNSDIHIQIYDIMIYAEGVTIPSTCEKEGVIDERLEKSFRWIFRWWKARYPDRSAGCSQKHRAALGR
jgi:pyruvate dehydrogenase complex dehydrogenase (E1) component